MLRGIGKHSSGRKQCDKATLLCASTTSACYVIRRRGIWYGFPAPCQALQLSGGSLFSRKRSWEQRGRHLIGQHAGVQTHLGGFLGWHISWCFSSACSPAVFLSSCPGSQVSRSIAFTHLSVPFPFHLSKQLRIPQWSWSPQLY